MALRYGAMPVSGFWLVAARKQAGMPSLPIKVCNPSQLRALRINNIMSATKNGQHTTDSYADLIKYELFHNCLCLFRLFE